MINYDKVQVASIRCLNISRSYNLGLPGIFNIKFYYLGNCKGKVLGCT